MVVHGKDPSIQPECWEQGGHLGARLVGDSRMPYVLVKYVLLSQHHYNNKYCRENFLKWWIKVEGLGHSEVRHLAEKIGEQPEQHSEADKSAEFSIPSWMVG